MCFVVRINFQTVQQCALFSGYLCLTAYWHSEQRIYKADYEKTKDKFTITTDDPRYQLARENRKMSQVNSLVVLYNWPASSTAISSPVLQTPDTGAWARGQTCWWSSSHG